MKFFLDFIPVVLFFVAYKFFGDVPPNVMAVFNQIPGVELSQADSKHAIIFGTLILILASIAQNIIHWLLYKRFEKMQLITMAVLMVFGSLTIFLRDPNFIKWKVTIVNWLFAGAMIGSLYIGEKPLIERMMGQVFETTRATWSKVTFMWVVFFFSIGLLNLVIAFKYPGVDDVNWVNFKMFGMLGLTLVFMVLQTIYLSKNAKMKDAEEQ